MDKIIQKNACKISFNEGEVSVYGKRLKFGLGLCDSWTL